MSDEEQLKRSYPQAASDFGGQGGARHAQQGFGAPNPAPDSPSNITQQGQPLQGQNQHPQGYLPQGAPGQLQGQQVPNYAPQVVPSRGPANIGGYGDPQQYPGGQGWGPAPVATPSNIAIVPIMLIVSTVAGALAAVLGALGWVGIKSVDFDDSARIEQELIDFFGGDSFTLPTYFVVPLAFAPILQALLLLAAVFTGFAILKIYRRFAVTAAIIGIVAYVVFLLGMMSLPGFISWGAGSILLAILGLVQVGTSGTAVIFRAIGKGGSEEASHEIR